MLTITQEIKRLEGLLDGETIEGLKLNDPGLNYKWVIQRIADLRILQAAGRAKTPSEVAEILDGTEQQLKALHRERGCVCDGSLLEHSDTLDMLVDSILDIALAERRDQAAITIRDLIYKYAK